MRVFGTPENIPGSVLQSYVGEGAMDMPVHGAIEKDPDMARACRIRAAAAATLERLDCSDALRRALRADHRSNPAPFCRESRSTFGGAHARKEGTFEHGALACSIVGSAQL